MRQLWSVSHEPCVEVDQKALGFGMGGDIVSQVGKGLWVYRLVIQGPIEAPFPTFAIVCAEDLEDVVL